MKHVPHVQLGLSQGLRTIGRQVGLGVTDALTERPVDQEPAWRAERLARGVVRGLDQGAEAERIRERITGAIDGGVEQVFTVALAQSPKAQALAEDIARALTRGALAELRTAVRGAASGLATPIVLGSVALVAGLFLTRAMLRPRRRR